MKISIITVCYNSEKTIKDTIESVLAQSYQDFEYIIVDGLSKDKTVGIIKQYSDSRIKLISEKDKGFYDALNKGIKMATGDIIGIINSDDVLYDNTVFKQVAENYKDETDILYANVKYYDEKLNKVVRDYISGKKYSNAWCPAHPSMYVRKETYQKIGTYNLDYRIVADYDFMVRCNKEKVNYTYVNSYFVKMRIGGISNGIKGYLNNFKECYFVLKKNGISFPLLNTIRRSIHTIIQIIVSKFK